MAFAIDEPTDWQDAEELREAAAREEQGRLDAAARSHFSPTPRPEERCTRACPLGHELAVRVGARFGWCLACGAEREAC